jgi:hypothetical protein
MAERILEENPRLSQMRNNELALSISLAKCEPAPFCAFGLIADFFASKASKLDNNHALTYNFNQIQLAKFE